MFWYIPGIGQSSYESDVDFDFTDNMYEEEFRFQLDFGLKCYAIKFSASMAPVSVQQLRKYETLECARESSFFVFCTAGRGSSCV